MYPHSLSPSTSLPPLGTNHQSAAKRVKFVREVVREVLGFTPYERRIQELLKVGRDKRALKFAKQRVSMKNACVPCPRAAHLALARPGPHRDQVVGHFLDPRGLGPSARFRDQLRPLQPPSPLTLHLSSPLSFWLRAFLLNSWAHTSVARPRGPRWATPCSLCALPPSKRWAIFLNVLLEFDAVNGVRVQTFGCIWWCWELELDDGVVSVR